MVQAAAAYAAKIIGSVVGYLGASAGAVSYAYQAAYYIAQAAILAGISYGVNALTRPRISRNLGTETDLQVDPAFPRQMMVGRRAIAGSLGPKYSYGPSNWGASIIYVIADHPMTACDRIFADGRLIHDTALTHGVRTEITAYNDGEAHMYMTWHDGRAGQTADAQLISNSAGDDDVIAGKIGAWTSAHKGAGVAYLHVELIFHPDYLVVPPRFLFECRGAPLYDRRLDTTAGGSGSHRLDDPSTWEYTDNAAVALDHYLLGYEVEGDARAFGIGLSPDEVPYATFAAAADLCDEDVTTGTGSGEEVIKRYRANGMIGAERYFEDLIQELQAQMVARVVDLGGTVGILGAEAKTPVVDLTDQDLVSNETIEYSDKRSFADLIGAVEGQFSDPGQLWEPTDYERQQAAGYQLPDGGELETLSLPLPFEIHPRRAARIARAHLNREQLQPMLAASFMPKAYKLEVGDWFRYTDDYLQLTDAEFEVVDIIKHADFTVTLTARAADADFVAFSVDDDVDLSVPPDFAPLDLALDVPTFTINAGTLTGGGSTKPVIKMTRLTVDTLAKNITFEWQEWNGSALSGESFTDEIHADQDVNYLRKGLLPSAQYKIRWKAKAGVRESVWSDWSAVITMTSVEAVSSAVLADGFVGQNWGATASEFQASNAKTPVGRNAIVDWRFNRLTDSEVWTVAGAGTRTQVISGQLAQMYGAITGTPAATSPIGIYQTGKGLLPIRPGDRLEASASVGGTGLSYADVYVFWWDAAGSLLSSTLAGQLNPMGSAIGGANLSNYSRIGGFATAPAGAYFASWAAYGYTDGVTASPTFWATQPFLASVPAAQTELTPFGPGFDGQPGSDVTIDNTAAAIVGQDWGATAAESEAGNTYAPVGRNLVNDVSFRRLSDTNLWTPANSTALPGSLYGYTTNQLRNAIFAITGTPALDAVVGLYQAWNAATPCEEGEKFEASAWVGGYHLDFIDVYVFWFNAAGSVFASTLCQRHGPPVTKGGGALYDHIRIGGVATAPANAVAAGFACYGYTQADVNPYIYCSLPMLARANADQTQISPWNAGLDGQPGADVTLGNIAAGFTGQAALATVDEASAVGYVQPTTGEVSTSFATKASLTVTTDGGPVEIDFQAMFNVGAWVQTVPPASESTKSIYAKVLRGATEVVAEIEICGWKFLDGVQATPNRIIGGVRAVDYPSAGTYTYYLQLKTDGTISDSIEPSIVSNANRLFKVTNPKDAANDVS